MSMAGWRRCNPLRPFPTDDSHLPTWRLLRKVIAFIEFAPGKGFPDLVPLRSAETLALWELVKVGRVRAAHYLDPLTGAFLELEAGSAHEARGWLAELPAVKRGVLAITRLVGLQPYTGYELLFAPT